MRDDEDPAAAPPAPDPVDRLILEEAAEALAAADGDDDDVVLDDRDGALTLAALAALPAGARIRVHQDRLTAQRSLARAVAAAGVADRVVQHDGLDDGLLGGARLVLLRLPRALVALDEIAGAVARSAHPEARVVAGGRVKHMSTGMNDVLRRHADDVHASLGRAKSRVLHASAFRPGGPGWPRSSRHDDLDLSVVAHGAAFAGSRVDLGTRALLRHLDAMAPDARDAIDLACGTGVLATLLARARPGLRVLATDESAAAVASARATAAANVADVEVVRDDGLAGRPDASADLILLNPPFHDGAAVDERLAHHLFADAARVLRPGGELWTVYNSHLPHRAVLQRLVGPTEQVARDPRFTVTVSRRGGPGAAGATSSRRQRRESSTPSAPAMRATEPSTE